ncbi:MAG: hypothetical protein P0119_05345 [Nitrospira sp.]|nr:hypothetical protein [Nitrospira sp.]
MKRGLHGLCLAMVLGMPTISTLAEQPDNVTSSGRVEVVLANEHRKDLEEIKKEFAEAGLTNLHVQFMKAGKPPTNIGLGPSVTAERARAAIRMAKKYNRDVSILLPERLFPPHYVAIASSSFDDTVEYPVTVEQLMELENPALTTEQFHALYRRLTPVDQAPVKKGRVF